MEAVLTIRVLVLAIMTAVCAQNAVAQPASDQLQFENVPEGTQASIISRGKTILIGRPSDASMQGRLIDLNGDQVLDAAIEELWDDGEVQVLRLRGEGFVAVHIACEPAIRSAYLAAATEAQAATDPDSGIRVIYGEQIDRLEVVNRNKAITRFRDELQAGCPIR